MEVGQGRWPQSHPFLSPVCFQWDILFLFFMNLLNHNQEKLTQVILMLRLFEKQTTWDERDDPVQGFCLPS